MGLASRMRPTGNGWAETQLAGVPLELHAPGYALLPAEGLMIVADLHLEKASYFAARGQMVPPYDSLATLEALDRVVRHAAPRTLALLGDSFHRPEQSLTAECRRLLDRVANTTALIWITGNHDPVLPTWLPGRVLPEFEVAGLSLRHEPAADGKPEVFGHFHPCARLWTRAGVKRRRCFLETCHRLVLPAFGALTGSLDASEPSLRALFPPESSRAHLIAGEQVHTVPYSALASLRANPGGR
jgi:DNA ligase-associated metallophosphoesterase